MESERAQRVAAGWARVRGADADVAEVFYDRLLDLEPRLADLFAATEMASQREKFVLMVDRMVEWVQDETRHEAAIVESGRRHAGYGVLGRHYRIAGEALLWAMDHVLPDGLDIETRAAWAEAYTRLAALMRNGADARERRRSPV